MKFNKHQQLIIKKIASGEITDISTYLKAFDLSTYRKLDENDILNRLNESEKGNCYKRLKKTFRESNQLFCNNDLVPQFVPNIPKLEDFEDVEPTIAKNGSKYTVVVDNSTKYEYDFFDGININNSFSDIKEFLTIWQFLKLEGLVLEVDKQLSKSDFEPFFEYKPINETTYGKTKTPKKTSITYPISDGLYKVDINELKSLYPNVKTDYVKDFRNYIDYYFEYNKANELICSQFICKQIYGNPELDAFIKNKFKTREQINFKWSLIPAYLALALTLEIAIWQKNDNSDIIKIQQQLDSIQQAIDNNNPDWNKIEQQLDDISKSDIYDGSTNEKLDEIIQQIKNYKDYQK